MIRDLKSALSDLKRFKNPTGFLLLLAISIVFAYLLKAGGIAAGVFISLAIVGPLIAFAMVAYPLFGIIILLIASNLLNFILRMNFTSFPLGTVMDLIYALLILGLFIKQKYEPDWSFLKNPISTVILIWLAYNMLQFANPTAESRMAWVYTIRGAVVIMLTYFIFCFHIRSKEFIRLIIKTWLVLSMFGALYGVKQQYFGFFGFEEAYLYSDPIIMDLLFINGIWRKFSIFSDPVVFSYNMVMSSLLCIGLMFAPMSIYKKIGLGIMICIFMTSMLYSGTRSAYILLPAAMLMLLILKFNRRIIMFTGAFALIFAFLIMVPTGNLTLYRFQSAFKPSNDASFNVRTINQKIIQPYIRSHPLGGGLGSTGQWAAKFSPWSFLASFPPDSGFVRVAIETGWIGLLLYCALIFIILKTGIENYYKIKDPELKSYCLAMVLIIFAINIGNYPQEAIAQFPNNIYFFLMAALMNVTYNLDKKISGEFPEKNRFN
jgi:putative inorganic carbon (HCO3(-)) transporter